MPLSQRKLFTGVIWRQGEPSGIEDLGSSGAGWNGMILAGLWEVMITRSAYSRGCSSERWRPWYGVVISYVWHLPIKVIVLEATGKQNKPIFILRACVSQSLTLSHICFVMDVKKRQHPHKSKRKPHPTEYLASSATYTLRFGLETRLIFLLLEGGSRFWDRQDRKV